MKKRTLAYIKKVKARKIIANPLGADLTTFLKASIELCRSNVVKKHIQHSVQNLETSAWYRLSA